MKIVNFGTAQVCRACLNVKPLSQFSKLKHTETGYSRYCKECGFPAHSYTRVRNKEQALHPKGESLPKAIKDRSLADLRTWA